MTPSDRGTVRTTAPVEDAALGTGPLVVDPRDEGVHLERSDVTDGVLVEADGETVTRTRVVLLPVPDGGAPMRRGAPRTEVLVDGWSVVVEVEPEARAALRERARRAGTGPGHGGAIEVRAIIPGRVLSVAVAAGDSVEAGQQLLVVEAMKMQNELRAPRAGVVDRVAVGEGTTVELGDLLVVLA